MRNCDSVSVRIDKTDYYEVLRVKEAHKRSIRGQAGYWLKIGRFAMDNPDMTGHEVEKLVVKTELKKQEGCVIMDKRK